MNNIEKVVLVAVIVVLIVGGGLIVFLQDNNREPVEEQSSMSHDMSSSTKSLTTETIDFTKDGTVNIEINNLGFKDSNIKIKQGSTVIWTNKDASQHAVMSGRMDNTQSHSTSGENSEIMSDSLKNGENYSFMFNEPSEYSYHCSKHPSETGNIVVTE